MKPTTRQVFDALSQGGVVRDLRTERGTCEGCGECCSRFLPLRVIDMVFLQSEIRKSGGGIVHERGPYDMRCPFLNDENMCECYEFRPMICTAYRCDLHARGEIWEWGDVVNGAVVFDLCEVADDTLSKMASAADGAVKDKAGNSGNADRSVAFRVQGKRVEASAVDAAKERGNNDE